MASAAGPPHVLVVDDEAPAAWALAYILGLRGYRVTTAPDGAAALAMFDADPAELVVTDLRMPRLDGRELIRRLRRIDRALPVIVMTGYLPLDGDVECFESVTVFKKPVDVQQLLSAIDRLTH